MKTEGMSFRQARTKAQELWGTNGHVDTMKLGKRTSYQVGVLAFGALFELRGSGASWEAAFTAAAEREKRLAAFSRGAR